MNLDQDFSRSPRQCQRQREIAFYYALGLAAALAIAVVMVLGSAIENDSARLQATTLMLQAELRQLQPGLAQVNEVEARIVVQREHLESQAAQALRRSFAPLALHALATLSPAHIRLQQIVVRSDAAEIRGAASGQRQLQDLIESLKASGLGQARLQEMQQEPAPTPIVIPPLRYSFTLTLDNSATVSSPVAPQTPLPAPATEAAPVQRAKRT